MVTYPEGSLFISFGSTTGKLCQCLGFKTKLIKQIDMGEGYEEPVYQQAKCYGWLYNCNEFTPQPSADGQYTVEEK